MMAAIKSITLSVPNSSTMLTEKNNNPEKRSGGSVLAVSLVTTTFVLLILIISLLVVFIVMRHKRLSVKKHSEHGIELEDEVQNPEVDSSRSQNSDRPPKVGERDCKGNEGGDEVKGGRSGGVG